MIGNKIITKKLLIILSGIIIGIVLNNSVLKAYAAWLPYGDTIWRKMNDYYQYAADGLEKILIKHPVEKTIDAGHFPVKLGEYTSLSDTDPYTFSFGTAYIDKNEFLIVKDYIFHKPVRYIGLPEEFPDDTLLDVKGIYIPDTVTQIKISKWGGTTAFDSVHFRHIYLSNHIKILPKGCFSFNPALERITLPSELKQIRKRAFMHCQKLDSVKIPDKVEIIGEEAFKDCRSISRIYLPKNIKEIGKDAFKNCKNITLYCEKDSYAYTYAKKHKLKTKLLSSEPVKIEKIVNLPDSVKVGTHEEYLLFPFPEPFYSSNQDFLYTSNDPSIADVNQNGKIEGKKKGTAIITVITKDGSHLKKEVKVTVQRGAAMLNPYFQELYLPPGVYHYDLNALIINRDPKATYKIKSNYEDEEYAKTFVETNLKGDTLEIIAKKEGPMPISFTPVELKEKKKRILSDINFRVIIPDK